jgi:hypothetical protein
MRSIFEDNDFEVNFLTRKYNISGMFIKTENEKKSEVLKWLT